MFSGRPMPQQQNPYELAPEVYVAAGRNQGFDKGYDKGHEDGYEAGRRDGWNDAMNRANSIIEQQNRDAIANQFRSSRNVLIGRVFLMTLEHLIRSNPEKKVMILKPLKQMYFQVAPDFINDGILQVLPHQDQDFISGSPKAAKLVLEALGS